MDTAQDLSASPTLEEHGTAAVPPPDKQPWQKPKLAFVEPTLTTHGRVQEVTAGRGFTP